MDKVFCVWFATSNPYCEYEKVLALYKDKEDAKQHVNECVEEDKKKIEKDVIVKDYGTKVVFENTETGEYHEYYIT